MNHAQEIDDAFVSVVGLLACLFVGLFVCGVYLVLAPFLEELHPHCWVSRCACVCEYGANVQVSLTTGPLPRQL